MILNKVLNKFKYENGIFKQGIFKYSVLNLFNYDGIEFYITKKYLILKNINKYDYLIGEFANFDNICICSDINDNYIKFNFKYYLFCKCNGKYLNLKETSKFICDLINLKKLER